MSEYKLTPLGLFIRKTDWRTVYIWMSIMISLCLMIAAFPTLKQDSWGYDSLYWNKGIEVTTLLFIIYIYWGYLRLCQRVYALEQVKGGK